MIVLINDEKVFQESDSSTCSSPDIGFDIFLYLKFSVAIEKTKYIDSLILYHPIKFSRLCENRDLECHQSTERE